MLLKYLIYLFLDLMVHYDLIFVLNKKLFETKITFNG